MNKIIAILFLMPGIVLADGTYRYENITDDEVMEIQRAVSGISSWPITMISGVSAKCRCEVGPACTSQVSVIMQRPGEVESLEVSKIDGHWSIGKWQKWLLRDKALWASYSKRARNLDGAKNRDDYYAYLKAERLLRLERPTCPKAASAPPAGSGGVSGLIKSMP